MKLRLLAGALLLALSVSAADWDWETTVSGFPSDIIVPNSSTLVTGATAVTAPQHVRVLRLHLSNTTASAVTVQVTDNSTNCNSGVCQPVPTITLQANQKVVMFLAGEPFVGGVKWSASVANAVHGWMAGLNN
jgi:hypothetical protein